MNAVEAHLNWSADCISRAQIRNGLLLLILRLLRELFRLCCFRLFFLLGRHYRLISLDDYVSSEGVAKIPHVLHILADFHTETVT